MVAVALLGLVPAFLVHLLLEEPLGHSHSFKQVVYAHALLDILKGFLQKALLGSAKSVPAAPGDKSARH